MCSQATATTRVGSKLRVGCGRKEVTAKCEEDFNLAVVHCLNGSNCVESVISRRLKIKRLPQPIEKQFGRTLPNSERAITLHIAMTPHRTKTPARLSDLPAQQHQVHDLLNVCVRVLMLREPHGPTKDRTLQFEEDLRCRFDLIPRYSALFNDLGPRNILQRRRKVIESDCVLVNELAIDRTVAACEHGFREPFQQRNITVDTHLQKQIGELRSRAK